MKLKSTKNLLLMLSIAVLIGVLIGTSLVSAKKEPGKSLLDNNGKVPQIILHPYLTSSKSRKTKGTLELRINISDDGNGEAMGATAPSPPIFSRSVNPIPTGEGRLSPSTTTGTPNVSPSGITEHSPYEYQIFEFLPETTSLLEAAFNIFELFLLCYFTIFHLVKYV